MLLIDNHKITTKEQTMTMRQIDPRNLKWPFEFHLRSKLHGLQMHVTVSIDFYDKEIASVICGVLQMTVGQWQAFRASLGYDEPLSPELKEQIKDAERALAESTHETEST